MEIIMGKDGTEDGEGREGGRGGEEMGREGMGEERDREELC